MQTIDDAKICHLSHGPGAQRASSARSQVSMAFRIVLTRSERANLGRIVEPTTKWLRGTKSRTRAPATRRAQLAAYKRPLLRPAGAPLLRPRSDPQRARAASHAQPTAMDSLMGMCVSRRGVWQSSAAGAIVRTNDCFHAVFLRRAPCAAGHWAGTRHQLTPARARDPGRVKKVVPGMGGAKKAEGGGSAATGGDDSMAEMKSAASAALAENKEAVVGAIDKAGGEQVTRAHAESAVGAAQSAHGGAPTTDATPPPPAETTAKAPADTK